jgi:hypothetical protein
MLGSIRDADRAGLGQLLDAAWRLHEQVQQLQPVRIGRRLCDLRDRGIECRFCVTVIGHARTLNYSIYILNS